MSCPKCNNPDYVLAPIGIEGAKQCTDCGEIYFSGEAGKPWIKPHAWREITKGQIDECLKHSDNYDFAWAIEAICKKNNGY
jgi:hypothetical protein